MTYEATRTRVETYFDRTATRTWERLTSDAPVSRIRETVRKGRNQMRDMMLGRLPRDLAGVRILDAGCGTGQMSAELAALGAEVVGVDISPQLVGIAEARLPAELRGRVNFVAGDMLGDHGTFDHVIAMDSLIYYNGTDIAAALNALSSRCFGSVVFSVAPRTPLLMTMWYSGKIFPRSDRSPIMVPHAPARLARDIEGVSSIGRVSSGFYISEAMELAR